MAPVVTNNNINRRRSRSMMTTSTSSSHSSSSSRSSLMMLTTVLSIASIGSSSASTAFVAPAARPTLSSSVGSRLSSSRLSAKRSSNSNSNNEESINTNNSNNNLFANLFTSPKETLKDPTQKSQLEKNVATLCTTLGFSAMFLTNPLLPHLPYSTHFASANAEDELYAKYGDKGLDTSLVDKDCLVNKCSLQAKACLQDDPECRKGLTCTAKCLGDNSCITGCFAKYGDPNLDNLLKCTIEDNSCIKVAILEGGSDALGNEPKSPAPTVQNFNLNSMEGTWYKVAGYNPNYDCYACQRNTFSSPEGGTDLLPNVGGLLGQIGNNIGPDRLQVDVEFSMPRLLDDGSPPPPSGVRESFESESGLQSVGYNAYSTHETMVFDTPSSKSLENMMKLGKSGDEKLYSRTAHSEGEMFGLKFWENWYIIGQNDPGENEFKFIYYNGKTRQNTYDGAFVYSRERTLSPSSMEKVYQIAKDAGMNPDQFCKIQNGCFDNDVSQPAFVEREGLGSPKNPFRGILASTKISEILGVESVAAEVTPRVNRVAPTIAKDYLQPAAAKSTRPWYKEVGDYLEDPRRHFRLMDSLRTDMDWPDYIKEKNN